MATKHMKLCSTFKNERNENQDHKGDIVFINSIGKNN